MIAERKIVDLAEEILRRMTVELEASGRHVHLTREAVEALFGPGHRLTPVKELSQPGQFACAERVTIVGPKGKLERVAVLGPERRECQVEVSLTDAVALGVKPPVRQSGQVEGSPGITLANGDRTLVLERGLIAALRHIHMTPADAEGLGLKDGDTVSLRTLTGRPVVLDGTVVRVSDKFATAAHLDYDEANACGWTKGSRGLILPRRA